MLYDVLLSISLSYITVISAANLLSWFMCQWSKERRTEHTSLRSSCAQSDRAWCVTTNSDWKSKSQGFTLSCRMTALKSELNEQYPGTSVFFSLDGVRMLLMCGSILFFQLSPFFAVNLQGSFWWERKLPWLVCVHCVAFLVLTFDLVLVKTLNPPNDDNCSLSYLKV